ncbi:MAG: hypothetical protein GKR86_13280 [Ilumatobacter sp.]|nr:hypothetical protein [bacterium]MDG2040754.1 hypothetical protein [Ilumatobacter sp.]NKB41980.1 hypothetical protein [Ilumatobacter sp.]
MSTNESATESKITPEDLRDKLQAFQGDVQGKVDDQKMSIATVAGGVGMALMILMFLLGKRAGKKKSAIVEIRRV